MNLLQQLQQAAADKRAHRIASMAAEELIRTEGERTNCPDEYAVPYCQADDHLRDCIVHLQWSGIATSTETSDGYIVVRFLEQT